MKPMTRYVCALAALASLALLQAPMPASAADERKSSPLEGVPLPAHLHGKWDFEGRFSNSWSLRVDRVHEDGRVEGRITWWGVRCSVKDEAISEGTLRDGRLRLRAPTDNRYVCGDLVVDLRASDKRLFEGEATSSAAGSNAVKAWLDRP